MVNKRRNIGQEPVGLRVNTPATPGRTVDREAGKAGVIYGLAAITRGEALGHGMWIDSEFLDQLIEAKNSVRCRFTHPGMSSDGLGTLLGTAKNFRREGDKVLHDLHFHKSAHETPDGDLAEYVMKLAEESPEFAGMSIVFLRDFKAEEAFARENSNDQGRFVSPDPKNKANLRHVRLKELRAVDVVDSPAANPDGLFSDGFLRNADDYLSYAFELTEEPPEGESLGIHPERGRRFVADFLDRNGLEVRPREADLDKADAQCAAEPEEDEMGDKTKNEESLSTTGGTVVTELLQTDPGVEEKAKTEERARSLAIAKEAAHLGLQKEGEDLIEAGMPEAEALAELRGLALDAMKKETDHDLGEGGRALIEVGVPGVDKLSGVMVDAICLGYGIQPEGRAEEAEKYAGIGLRELARVMVEAQCGRAPALDSELFASANSTGSFPIILGNVLRKHLARGYETANVTFTQWAGTRSVNDFKEVSEASISGFGALTEIGDGGEFTHATLAESSEKYGVGTFGKMIVLTRKTWVNDDLHAFTRLPVMLGEASARSINQLGYGVLTSNSGVGPTMNEDGQPLFVASGSARGQYNYRTGTTAATTSVFGDTGLRLAKTLMRKVRDLPNEDDGSEGALLNLTPEYLLVPPELEFEADSLVQSTELLLATGEDATKVMGNKNVHRRTVKPIVEAELSDATNGTTAWYLVANAMRAASMVVVYLKGKKNPTIEQVKLENKLGWGWRLFHDYGVAAVNWRGIERNKGA